MILITISRGENTVFRYNVHYFARLMLGCFGRDTLMMYLFTLVSPTLNTMHRVQYPGLFVRVPRLITLNHSFYQALTVHHLSVGLHSLHSWRWGKPHRCGLPIRSRRHLVRCRGGVVPAWLPEAHVRALPRTILRGHWLVGCGTNKAYYHCSGQVSRKRFYYVNRHRRVFASGEPLCPTGVQTLRLLEIIFLQHFVVRVKTVQ